MSILKRFRLSEMKVADDRGQQVIWRIGTEDIYSGQIAQGLDEETRRELHRCLGKEMRSGMVFRKGERRPKKLGNDVVLALLFILAFFNTMAWSNRWVFGVRGIVTSVLVPIGFSGMMGLLIMAWLKWAVEQSAPRAADLLVGRGYCGACGYALSGLETSAEGYKVCPECSACWLGERVGTHGADMHGQSSNDELAPVSEERQ